MRHTVVLSDLHLWEAVDGDGLWMRYRQRRFFPDDSIARLLEALTRDVPNVDFELVLDGDIFDFDVPRPDGRDDTPHTEGDAARRIDRILDDHPVFVTSLAKLVSRGHRVVFVSGNHDVQLAFAAVRERVLARLESVSADLTRGAAVGVRARVLFRAWFHRTRDGIHIEHGHMYDPYCATRYPQTPFVPGTREVQPTLSSLTMRHLAGQFGYFNPNADKTFLLTLPGYLSHWVRYYLFTRRSLVMAWFIGTLRVIAGLVRGQPREEVERALNNLLRTARETGAPLEALSEHATLFARQEHLRAARILWVDKLTLACVAALVALVAVFAHTTGLVLAAALACVATLIARALPDGDLDRIYALMEPAQREVARIHGARAVVFGHTHIARGAWLAELFVGNCGTWAPMFHDIACTQSAQRGSPFVWLRSGEGGALEGGLYRVEDGEVTPVEGSVRTVSNDSDDPLADAMAA